MVEKGKEGTTEGNGLYMMKDIPGNFLLLEIQSSEIMLSSITLWNSSLVLSLILPMFLKSFRSKMTFAC